MARQKAIAVSEHSYNVLLQPEPEGGYTVTCPSLPGLVTYGETLEEARAMAVEAIEAYLESLQIDGEPIPESDVVEPGVLVEPVRVRREGRGGTDGRGVNRILRIAR
jgi:antitoxin HicB